MGGFLFGFMTEDSNDAAATLSAQNTAGFAWITTILHRKYLSRPERLSSFAITGGA